MDNELDISTTFDYKSLRQTMSDEEASEMVAQELERIILHIRSGKWPVVYSMTTKTQVKGPFTEVKLILTYPWGG